MAPPGIMVLSVFFTFFAAVIGRMVKADFNHQQVLKICNGQQNFDVDFGICRGTLLFKIEEEAMSAELHDVYEKGCQDNSDARVFAHAVCTETLPDNDCFNCLRSASDQLIEECTNNVGGQMTLMDCHVRFEQYHFNNDV
ncbi:hypothetical protein MLD38_033088 [Melastoma candidum]|uniref:Uncharacterized protein n=1 Tax=Melastoma candidum TaxID=119954 RepID=A0ACB9M5E5_9MYRT|nr:hypothetical protein MLD38_033088 [Melastoma candidum]